MEEHKVVILGSGIAGMTAGIYENSPYGVQINSSSRFEANGGSYPITLTYTNLRFKRE